MSITRKPAVIRAACAALLISSFTLVGCPKHEDFPAALDIEAPEKPASFTATYDGFDESLGRHNYTLNWTINDPTDVVGYRIYLYDSVVPRLVASTTATTLATSFPFEVTGLQLGVSAVSTGNIEGPRRILVVPAP